MRSLRRRLTLSYAVLVAVVLSLVAMVASLFVFDFLSRPMVDALNNSEAIARAISRAHPHAPASVVGPLIQRAAAHDGVRIMGRFGRARGAGFFGPPPGGGPSHDDPGPPGHFLDRLLGVSPRTVNLNGGSVFIAPDFRRVRNALNLYLETLALAILASIVIAWLIARWITNQAVAPLLLVTGELQRFAAGDFTPRTLATNDRSELGALTEAYNGAAAQVSAALRERIRVEQHMRRFVAEAGHELRTPLTVVVGYIDVLRRGGWSDDDIRDRALATLGTETTRMRRLVERLMALARLERPEPSAPEIVDVAEIAAGAIEAVTMSRTAAVKLETHGEPRIMGDPGELHEAIGNLVDNAIKYGDSSAVNVTVAQEPHAVTVRVRDGGPGIPAAERPRLFERFFRGDHRDGIDGSGLGLAIVARAAERCGGSIELENGEPGRTCFTLRFGGVSREEGIIRP